MANPSQFCFWILVAGTLFLTFVSTETATYIVHMDKSFMPKAFSDHHGWYTAILSAVLTEEYPPQTISAHSPDLLYVYDKAIHGFSARLSSSQLTELQKTPGFLTCYGDTPITMDTTHTFQFLGLNDHSGIWPVSNYGKGVIVGVVDTGVWPESESYGDDGMEEVPSRWKGFCEQAHDFNSSMCNKKLIGARSFNKGLSANDPDTTIAGNSPRDTDGHGTHTSSTAAGNYAKGASFFGYAPGTARGMAPRAHLAVYKAHDFSSDALAGIDQAISDGVDVLSLSFRTEGFPLYNDPVAIASYAAMEQGIFVAASAGNRGNDLRTVTNDIPWLLTVGASTVDRGFSGIVELGDGTTIIGASLYVGIDPPSLKNKPLVFMNACDNSTLLEQIRQKLAVCEGSELSDLKESVSKAKIAGGIFLYNSSDVGDASRYETFTFPGVIVSRAEDLQAILRYTKSSSTPTASIKFQQTLLGTKPEPSVAYSSSRGPSRSCPYVLKPDLLAPGTLILAAWSRRHSVAYNGSHEIYAPYNILSGTSMACPHAAGVAALLKAAHPDWSPAAIRSAMMTTANPLDNTRSPTKDSGDLYREATPFAMGAGRIDPNAALDPGLVYDAGGKDYMRLLCAMNYTKEQIFTITRSPGYDCSGQSRDLNYPSFVAHFEPDSSTPAFREFRRTVRNVEDGMWIYRARVTRMKGFSVRIEPEKLVFKGKNEEQSFKMTIEGPKNLKSYKTVHGSLRWVDDRAGKYVVRSPIMITTIPLTLDD